MLVLGLNYTIDIDGHPFQVAGFRANVVTDGLGNRSVSPIVLLKGNDGVITEVDGKHLEVLAAP